jgi:DNA-binding NarL/FixJ family response regulator
VEIKLWHCDKKIHYLSSRSRFSHAPDGVTATRAIRGYHPTAHNIAFTSTVEADLIEAALDTGVDKCLTKDTQIKQIVDALLEIS